MIPVDQEFTHNPSEGTEGDCFRAVLASILELPIADVPHFAAQTTVAGEFWSAVYDWLEAQGYQYWPGRNPPEGALEYHALSGPSPRTKGGFHATVGLNGQVVHDPHPSRSGISGFEPDWYFGYLIPISKKVS